MDDAYNPDSHKIVAWNDNGISRLALLPFDAPDEEAPLGVQIGFDLDPCGYPDHFALRLHKCLWERGYQTRADFEGNLQALTDIRRCLQLLIRADANDIYQTIINGDST